ncbi:alpha/beta hydrolase family esterase [Amycolatopsis vancoresmycina]|uniref:Putative LpqC protein n=1 Tax=Amycolatopsis vancoresmycina DSM 44592 TaxID=1292037 RepID=R1I188_9PSEU|nr:PHB depolymerase family esterase [Amycolatopsis vancoresmycina]EOD64234.1 putative LpqC protein [Amycolatopsis vancoresmycina DSM 44592]
MLHPRKLAGAVLAFLLGTGPVVAGPPPASASTACTLAPTSGTVAREAAGRAYHVNVPPGLPGAPVPLLLSLHGALQPYALHERETRWSDSAAAKHFIVAYPSAAGPAWDADRRSGDVAYLRAVVEDVSRTWCVDPHRVHVEGFSSGANMSARLACDASDVFASVAAYAGVSPAFTGSPCTPDRPISVGLFHSDGDLISLPPLAVAHRNEWLQRNGCPATPVTEPGVPVEAAVYGPCRAGVQVVWRVYRGTHFWPGDGDRADIAERMWAFFARNPLP